MSVQRLLQKIIGTALVLLLLVGCGAPAATPSSTPTNSGPTGEGTISVSPTTVSADSFETLTFQFTVGPSGMEVGGGVSLQFPTRRDRTLLLLWDDCQSESPDETGYVEASADRATDVDVDIECARKGVLKLIIARGALLPGEKIDFAYTGNVQAIARTLTLRVHSRRNEHESWKPIAALPEIQILPAEAAFLLVVTPADVEKDTDFDLAVVMLDKFGNRATGYRGTVSFTSTDSEARLPTSYTFTAQDAGVHVFSGTQYRMPDFQRITVTDGSLTGQSNYSHVVSGSFGGYRRYFGDTQFHTGTGLGDHRGEYTTAEEAYVYARDVMRLDFASVSEHDSQAFTDALWTKSQDITDSFYQPGVFTTFFAYEWTSWDTGHRVVMYKDYGQGIYRSVDENHDTPTELWAALEEQGAPFISIPHVMGEWSEEFDVHPLWVDINNGCQPIGEIYSQHNLINRGGVLSLNPQRFELGIDDTWSYQYAWHMGHRIGVIGSTDNHLGTPGANDFTPYVGHPGGLAVVLAERNDRDAIWDTFQNRRTYATTGTRIFLNFQIDGHLVGDEFASTANPTISVAVAGTDRLEMIELIKHDRSGYAVIHVEEPDSEISSFDYVDADFKESSFYYVRVTQVDGEMAWSSPIWITWGSE